MSAQPWCIRARAPGKMILFGEYAVLYGNTGVLSAVDLWTSVTIRPSLKGQLEIKLSDFDFQSTVGLEDIKRHLDSEPSFEGQEARIQTACSAIFRACKSAFGSDLSLWDISIEIHSDVPVSKGLGSSSALSCALAAALLKHCNHAAEPSKEEIKALALQCEHLFHGRTSGIDVEVSVYGGMRAFREGHSVPVQDLTKRHCVLLIDTGIPRDSKRMIGIAKQSLSAMDSEMRQKLLGQLENITQKYLSETPPPLEDAVEPFQAFLKQIGVSHPAIDSCIVLLKRKWGIKAKITGAGGGGFIYALFPCDRADELIPQVKAELKQNPETFCFDYQLSYVRNTSQGVQVSM